jgi:formylglycine-generating enzyme required for sulfatase activity
MDTSDSPCCAPSRDSGEEEFSKEVSAVTNTAALLDSNFVTIPAGYFLMGTDEDFYPTDGENPARRVWTDEYQISKYSVTNQEFARFVDETSYVTDAENFSWSYVYCGFLDEETISQKSVGVAGIAPWWVGIKDASWSNPFGNGETIESLLNHPVVHISRNDAQAFCRWSGTRLPTEAEWERASRGGLSNATYPWGNDVDINNGEMLNVWMGEFLPLESRQSFHHGTMPVDSFSPNSFGIYNTVGNVWEWTSDTWSARWHIADTPETRRNPKGPASGGKNVLKGGSFMCHDSYCYRYRNSARSSNSPETSTSNIGFRCAR